MAKNPRWVNGSWVNGSWVTSPMGHMGHGSKKWPIVSSGTGVMRRTETSKLISELRWDSLSSRRTYFEMLHFFKKLCKLSSQYLIDCMPNNVNLNYKLRNTSINHLTPFKCRIESYKKSFFPICTSMWNDLSEELKLKAYQFLREKSKYGWKW